MESDRLKLENQIPSHYSTHSQYQNFGALVSKYSTRHFLNFLRLYCMYVCYWCLCFSEKVDHSGCTCCLCFSMFAGFHYFVNFVIPTKAD